jgi:hypothetical protein
VEAFQGDELVLGTVAVQVVGQEVSSTLATDLGIDFASQVVYRASEVVVTAFEVVGQALGVVLASEVVVLALVVVDQALGIVQASEVVVLASEADQAWEAVDQASPAGSSVQALVADQASEVVDSSSAN